MAMKYALYNPATHVAVPMVPTPAMYNAYWKVDARSKHAATRRYAAMLAAAPPPVVEIDPTRSDVALAKLILERLGYSVEGNQHRVDWVAEEICKFRETRPQIVDETELTEEQLVNLMQDPRYWKRRDLEILDKINRGFRKLYGEGRD